MMCIHDEIIVQLPERHQERVCLLLHPVVPLCPGFVGFDVMSSVISIMCLFGKRARRRLLQLSLLPQMCLPAAAAAAGCVLGTGDSFVYNERGWRPLPPSSPLRGRGTDRRLLGGQALRNEGPERDRKRKIDTKSSYLTCNKMSPISVGCLGNA